MTKNLKLSFMITGKLFFKCLFFFTIIGSFASCYVTKSISKENQKMDSAYVPKITIQKRENFTFNNGNLIFSNQFLSGRLNRIDQINDSTFNIFIEPENRPINPSPWYAFKIWSKNSRNVTWLLIIIRINIGMIQKSVEIIFYGRN